MARFYKFGNTIINLEKIIEVDQRNGYFLARVDVELWIKCLGEFPDQLIQTLAIED